MANIASRGNAGIVSALRVGAALVAVGCVGAAAKAIAEERDAGGGVLRSVQFTGHTDRAQSLYRVGLSIRSHGAVEEWHQAVVEFSSSADPAAATMEIESLSRDRVELRIAVKHWPALASRLDGIGEVVEFKWTKTSLEDRVRAIEVEVTGACAERERLAWEVKRLDGLLVASKNGDGGDDHGLKKYLADLDARIAALGLLVNRRKGLGLNWTDVDPGGALEAGLGDLSRMLEEAAKSEQAGVTKPATPAPAGPTVRLAAYLAEVRKAAEVLNEALRSLDEKFSTLAGAVEGEAERLGGADAGQQAAEGRQNAEERREAALVARVKERLKHARSVALPSYPECVREACEKVAEAGRHVVDAARKLLEEAEHRKAFELLMARTKELHDVQERIVRLETQRRDMEKLKGQVIISIQVESRPQRRTSASAPRAGAREENGEG